MSEHKFLLTQFAHGAGCGCKIAPQVLEKILKTDNTFQTHKQLLVGNKHNDDAAVYDLGNGNALISTTDFFTPIVDDAYDFGRVAAANAISDVYAMGGKPLMALALLGWPINKLPVELAQKVMEGARNICEKANIPLAGGHSIDSSEPIFGLSVNGMVKIENIKKNTGVKGGDYLLMTKPVGSGILSTAQKRGTLESEDKDELLQLLTQLNNIGELLGEVPEVNAMTDITGFGFLGHLIEVTNGSNVSVEVDYEAIPKLKSINKYLNMGMVPDATFRNWNAFHSQLSMDEDVNIAEAFSVLPDPQTNGGLLIAVSEKGLSNVQAILTGCGYSNFIQPIGKFIYRSEKAVRLKK